MLPCLHSAVKPPGSARLAALATLDYPQQSQDHDDDQYNQQHVDYRVK
jgi:hypothetical protein